MISALGATMVTGSGLGTLAKSAATNGTSGTSGKSGKSGGATSGGGRAGESGPTGRGGAGGAARGGAASGRRSLLGRSRDPPAGRGRPDHRRGFGFAPAAAELVSAGLSIARSMKRLTDAPDASGYGPGDVAQLLGDAAQIGALATILARPQVWSPSRGPGPQPPRTPRRRRCWDRLRRGFGSWATCRASSTRTSVPWTGS